MIRTLFASTAVAALLTTGALADNHNTSANAEMFQTIDENDRLASRLLGMAVYSSAAEDAERFGEINDFVVDADGNTGAVIIGVGGFLGMGEKEVAISFDEVQWETGKDGQDWLVVAATREDLEAAPAFDRAAFEAQTSDQRADAAAPASDSAMTDEQAAMDAEQTDQTAETMQADQTAETTTANAERPDDMATEADNRRDQMAEVPAGDISAEKLIGTRVYGADSDSVGEVGDVILTGDGTIDAIIVDVGGFLGLGEKPVAIAFDDLQFLADRNGSWQLHTNFTQEQLENQVAYDRDTYAAQRDQQRLRVN